MGDLSSSITARQLQVIKLTAEGYSGKEIAHILGIRETTIKIHLYAIFRALQLPSKVAVVVKYKLPASTPANRDCLPLNLKEVFDLLAMGKTNAEICELLAVPDHYAKKMVYRTLKLIGARNRCHLVGMWNKAQQIGEQLP